MAREMASQGPGVPEMTAKHRANNETKEKVVNALFANDWDTIATLLHPDFELREPEALPYGGTYKGVEGFKEVWAKIPASGHQTEYLTTVQSFFAADPDSIIVELDTRGTNKNTGAVWDTKVLERFDFTDGKISAISLYWFDVP